MLPTILYQVQLLRESGGAALTGNYVRHAGSMRAPPSSHRIESARASGAGRRRCKLTAPPIQKDTTFQAPTALGKSSPSTCNVDSLWIQEESWTRTKTPPWFPSLTRFANYLKESFLNTLNTSTFISEVYRRFIIIQFAWRVIIF